VGVRPGSRRPAAWEGSPLPGGLSRSRLALDPRRPTGRRQVGWDCWVHDASGSPVWTVGPSEVPHYSPARKDSSWDCRRGWRRSRP